MRQPRGNTSDTSAVRGLPGQSHLPAPTCWLMLTRRRAGPARVRGCSKRCRRSTCAARRTSRCGNYARPWSTSCSVSTSATTITKGCAPTATTVCPPTGIRPSAPRRLRTSVRGSATPLLPYCDRAFDPGSPVRQGGVLRELVRFDPALEAHPRNRSTPAPGIEREDRHGRRSPSGDRCFLTIRISTNDWWSRTAGCARCWRVLPSLRTTASSTSGRRAEVSGRAIDPSSSASTRPRTTHCSALSPRSSSMASTRTCFAAVFRIGSPTR